MVFTIGLLYPFMKDAYDLLQWQAKNKPEGYRTPELKDFWITGVSIIGFTILDLIFKTQYKWFYPYCKI